MMVENEKSGGPGTIGGCYSFYSIVIFINPASRL